MSKLWTRLQEVEIKIKKKLCRHDQTEVVIFVHNKNRLHSPTLVKFPFDQPSHKGFSEMLDCVEALNHVCPLFLWVESLLGSE
jgi:hypothetical protein